MEYKYPHLFSPIKVGRLTLKNRIEAAPVNISNLPISGYPTAENIAKWLCHRIPHCIRVSVQETEGNVATYEKD